ncbi:MAG: HD domain-containing protein, partial [Anaerovoracaceae bacterium]
TNLSGKIFVDKIGPEEVIMLCANTLKAYDTRLVDHGNRVAYIADSLCRSLYKNNEIDEKALLLLALFHDVGAYKTNEIDKMVTFDCEDVFEHSLYGYLFLKYFSPLGDMGAVILNHHCSNEEYEKKDFEYKDYSNLIQIADRVDIAIGEGCSIQEIIQLIDNNKRFDQNQVNAMKTLLEDTDLCSQLENNQYVKKLQQLILATNLTIEETSDFLRMMVYSIDFKSPTTVVHTIVTTRISLFLARALEFEEEEIGKVYIASTVHDLGKIVIPEEILEKPGKLDFDQMEIMKKHVEYTEEIIKGVLPDDVCKIAIRHHEKLDGSGYPHGIVGSDLSLSERVVAVADIVSALISQRSYKEPFDKAKTLSIINQMAQNNLIDSRVVNLVTEKYDEILDEIQLVTGPVIEKYHTIQQEYMEQIEKHKIE